LKADQEHAMMNEKTGSAARTALVTGGGRGIGAACSLLCAAQGWAVAVNYARDAGAANALVERIRAGGGQALAVQADVADEAQVLAMFATIDRELPPLGALVNNAGVVDRAARVDAMSVGRLQRMFAINVIGSFVCAREAVKRMSTAHGGQGLRWRWRPKAYASMRYAPASSKPRSMHRAGRPNGCSRSRRNCRCAAPAARTRWRRRLCGCCRVQRATSRGPRSTSVVGDEQLAPIDRSARCDFWASCRMAWQALHDAPGADAAI
jgi:NAD(P)-dependent dehydrogenase (short-subunit alcohol dehydrogenase family)